MAKLIGELDDIIFIIISLRFSVKKGNSEDHPYF